MIIENQTVHTPVVVKLSLVEIEKCAKVRIQRRIQSRRRGLQKNKDGFSGFGWNEDIVGACGEKAVANHLHAKWGAHVNAGKSQPDIEPFHEVRTRLKHDYDLIIRTDDNPGRIYWLVTSEDGMEFRIWGWIKYGQASQYLEYSQKYGGRPAAYFIPAGKLNPPEDESWRTAQGS